MQIIENAQFVDPNAKTARMLLNVLAAQKGLPCQVQFVRKPAKMDISIINQFAQYALQVAQNVQPLITAHNALIRICLRVQFANQSVLIQSI